MSKLVVDKNQAGIVDLYGVTEVEVGAGVDAVFVDNDGDAGARTINVGEDANVQVLRFYRAQENRQNEDSLTVNVQAGARVETTAVYLGNYESKVNLHSHVHASNARSDLRVLYFADQKQKLHLKVRNDFYQKDSAGQITVKGVAANKATVEIFGEIGIAQTAGGTDSSLDQHALIWGKGSKVRQLPILEINTNDVSAAHGATVSRIQDEELFYFLARGIHRDEAYNLCVNGFLASLLEELEGFGEYHEQILEAIADRTYKVVNK